jgi:hypothetical protein
MINLRIFLFAASVLIGWKAAKHKFPFRWIILAYVAGATAAFLHYNS